MTVSKFTLALGVLLGTAMLLPADALAHGGHGKHYDRPGHYPVHHKHWRAPARSKRMPDWLYYQRDFRRWYRHSAIRHQRHIPWWKVYRIYQRQTYAYPYYGYRGDYDRDRWRDWSHRDRGRHYRDDRRFRDDRRRRHRDDD